MKKIRDFIYDISDFIIVLAIIAIIGFAISLIMKSTVGIDIPQEIATQKQSEQGDKTSSEPQVNDNTKPSDNKKENTPSKDLTKPKDEENKPSDSQDPTKPVDPQAQENQPSGNEDTTETQEQTNAFSDNDDIRVLEDGSLEVRFAEGQTLNTFANNLQEAGVISDATNFQYYLVDEELDTLVRPGNYNLTKDMSNEQVRNVLFPEQSQ